MRELDTLSRVRRIIEIATGEPYGDGYVVMDVAVGYAEPGYGTFGSDDDVIVFGNWNPKRFPRGDDAPLTKEENLGPRLARALEAAGASLEWYDEWYQCSDCYRAVRATGDSYSWTPSFVWMNECEPVCADCATKDPESLVEDYINEPTKALTVLSGSDLSDLGFEQENGTYENGWHEGQDDDPTKILARIHKFEPTAEVVFIISENSQFYMKFQAWVRVPEQEDDNQ